MLELNFPLALGRTGNTIVDRYGTVIAVTNDPYVASCLLEMQTEGNNFRQRIEELEHDNEILSDLLPKNLKEVAARRLSRT